MHRTEVYICNVAVTATIVAVDCICVCVCVLSAEICARAARQVPGTN